MNHKRTLLYEKICLGLVVIYFIGAALFLFIVSLPTTKSGLFYLQRGEQQLITNNAGASEAFQQAQQAFESTALKLNHSPFIARVAALLPPFRWHVRLLKATHALAEAGEEASQLSSSFPTLLPEKPGTVSQTLSESSSEYLDWYSQHTSAIYRLRNNLEEAQSELDAIPTWIMFGERDALQQLQAQVRTVSRNTNLTINLTEQLSSSLGATDSSDHAILLLFSDSDRPLSYALAYTHQGHITTFELGSRFPPSHETAPSFFSVTAPIVKEQYQPFSKYPIELVIQVDKSAFQQLLVATGAVSLPNHGVSITSTTAPATLFSAGTLSELLPLLIQKGSTLPSTQLSTVFVTALQQKELQMWSDDNTAEHTLTGALPLDAPTANNWVKLVDGADIQSLTIEQAPVTTGSTLSQSLTISGGKKSATLLLPKDATAITSNSSFRSEPTDTYNKVTLEIPATLGYRIPATASSKNKITYIAPPGDSPIMVKAFSFSGMVKSNLVLTR